MRWTLSGTLLLVLFSQTASGQVQTFPYEAVIDGDGVIVHSGPGQKYYATSRLNRGDRVVVHRHDPGGWYMIAPPTGSFSWIRADGVRRLSGNRGIVSDNNVIVRVGSSFDDSRDVFQARLSTGAAVEIIGAATVQTETGPVQMLKITPPAGEWRWIPGRNVTPVDQVVRNQYDRDPYAIPTGARREIVETKPSAATGPRLENGVVERPQIRSNNAAAVRRSGPSEDEIARDRRRMKELDDDFRAIIDSETSRWEFAQLEEDYRQLQQQVALPALAGQIDLRLAAVDRYRKVKAEYDDFIRLTSETAHRDAQLMTLQQTQLRQAAGTIASTPVNGAAPRSILTQSAPATQTEPMTLPALTVPTTQPSHDGPPVAAPQPATVVPQRQVVPRPIPQPQPAPQPQFLPPVQQTVPQGVPQQSQVRRVPSQPQAQPAPQAAQRPLTAAGIVQRAVTPAPGGPQHVLLAPNGRILAWLQNGSGMNLDQYIGRPMGLYGEKLTSPDNGLQTIVVDRAAPVRLQP